MARGRIHPLAALRRFARARRGSTAVEFALVSAPFLLLLFGIIELGCVFMVSATLDVATERAARLIRTGEFQSSGAVTKNDFKAQVCQRMSWLSSACAGNLAIDVRTFTAFNDVNGAPILDNDDFDANNTCFSTGAPGDIVLVRTYYNWNLFTPLLDDSLDNTGDGQRRVMSVATFRNEPYNDDDAVGAAC